MKFGYVVRIDMKSGLHLEFGYENRANAEQRYMAVRACLGEDDATFVISDDMGHSSEMLAREICHVAVCDIAAEIAGRVSQNMIAQEAEKRAVAAAQRGSVLMPRPGVLGPGGSPIINGGH